MNREEFDRAFADAMADREPRSNFALPPLRLTWGPGEVAQALGISRREVSRMVAKGLLPAPDPRLTSGGRKRMWLAAVMREHIESLAQVARSERSL